MRVKRSRVEYLCVVFKDPKEDIDLPPVKIDTNENTTPSTPTALSSGSGGVGGNGAIGPGVGNRSASTTNLIRGGIGEENSDTLATTTTTMTGATTTASKNSSDDLCNNTSGSKPVANERLRLINNDESCYMRRNSINRQMFYTKPVTTLDKHRETVIISFKHCFIYI